MLSLNPAKFFVIAVFFSFLCTSCGWWKNSGDSVTPTPTPFAAREIPSDIPFQTKEPEIYQAEFVVTIYNNGEKTESKTFVVRNGGKRLTIFNAGEEHEISLLKIATNQTVLINHARKIFSETTQTGFARAEDGLTDFLTTEWLNEKTSAAFENLGTENDLTRYRVNLEDARSTEILIYVDENLQIPVRQEFYSAGSEQKTLMYSAEIRNFKLQAEEKYFEIPKNYKKVSAKDFYNAVRQDKQK